MADDIAAKVAQLTAQFEGAALHGIMGRVASRAEQITSGAVAPKTLSNYRRRGYVHARVKDVASGRFDLLPTPAGLAALLTVGSGTTWKKRGGGSFQRRRVPPRGAWSKGVDAVTPQITELVHDEVVKAIGKVF